MSDAPASRVCPFCGRDVEPADRAFWRTVKGWGKPGHAGGSDIALREYTLDAVAHDTCIRLAQKGITPTQLRLA